MKPILRLITFLGYIILIPVLIYFIFTGKHYLELFDKIDKL